MVPNTYVVDLKNPPETRWLHIIEAEKEKILRAHKVVRKLVSSQCPVWLGSWAIWLCSGKMLYYKEIESIANCLGVPLLDVVLMQVAYELFASCTSIVALPGKHIRTMDWAMNDLKDITIHVNFVHNGYLLANVTTWAGYVGVLTGMRPNGYSVSINFRGTSNRNLGDALWQLWKCHRWPVGYLVRDTLLKIKTYEYALSKLSESPLISPTYIIICGKERADVLARDRDLVDEKRTITVPGQFLVQTNCNVLGRDDNNIFFSKERLDTAHDHLKKKGTDWSSLRSLITRWPCHNALHIYTTEMGCMDEHYASYF
jgi:hypothetical protein